MRAGEWLGAIVGVILLGAGAAGVWISHGPAQDTVNTDACRSPVTILEPRTPRAAGSAVVFHGLSANRRMMQTLGQWLAAEGLRVYLVDLPGHGDSTEPFSFLRASACAGAVVDSLVRRGQIATDRTVLVGHSMGAAIAIQLADDLPTAATIAISPAPMVPTNSLASRIVHFPMPRRMPINLLILRGAWEPAASAESHHALLRAAGGGRIEPEDFAQRRAAWLAEAPHATHTSLLFDPWVRGWVVEWARNALEIKSEDIRYPGFPVLGGLLGIAGLAFLFPLAARATSAVCRAGAREAAATPAPPKTTLARWALAAAAAVILLRFWVPLRALRMYNGDYLASFFLLVGVALLAGQWDVARSILRGDARALLAGGVLGLATILAFGAWVDWQLYDGWLNAPRWLRFLPLFVFCLPYFAAEELALGAPATGKNPRRFGLFLALRFLLWAALLAALFALHSGQILVLLIALYLALFSVLQRWASDALRRRTGSAAAAAVFSAILAAWFLAGVYPLM